jgi:hypothetical protein
VSTPVRVTATTVVGTQTLTTQSDQLTVSTGVPAQGGFSLSVSTFNIEGYVRDGTTTTITARLADRFSNPVPDGVVVNFTSAGGSIGASCTTVNGACSVTMNSQNFRTTNGRIAILAYAIGEESFTDRNGNGWFDAGELVDLNNKSTDLPEAWLDVKEKNDETAYVDEPFIDFNSDGSYTRGDLKFNGVSCDDVTPGRSSAGSCGTTKSIHVRGRQVVLFSGSVAVVTPSSDPVALGICSATSEFKPSGKRVLFSVHDERGNVMPAGTKVEFTTTKGAFASQSVTSFTVPNSTACLASFTALCPPSSAVPKISTSVEDGVGRFAVTLISDVTQSGTAPSFTCSTAPASGLLTATVTTPSGQVTRRSVTVTD